MFMWIFLKPIRDMKVFKVLKIKLNKSDEFEFKSVIFIRNIITTLLFNYK